MNNQGPDYLKKIEEARKVLALPQIITRNLLIKHYKHLARKYHPDKGGDEEKFKKLREAYEILLNLCDNYPIDLTKKETFDPQNFWFYHFGSDPICGKKEDK